MGLLLLLLLLMLMVTVSVVLVGRRELPAEAGGLESKESNIKNG